MNIHPGSIIASSASLKDPHFKKAVIFIAEHNEKGALGFIINKPFPRALNELVEFRDSAAFPLFEGGPVEKESLYFLHCRPDMIEGGTPVAGAVHMGGNFKQAVAGINNKTIQPAEIKLFIGYCGWNDHELEDEIEEGSWLITGMGMQAAFLYNTGKLWEEVSKGI